MSRLPDLIAPSILAADFARLGEQTEAVLTAGADIVHFDVMDNHFVPNLTIGPQVCAALRRYGITADIDVHLMVEPVERLIEDFAEAGASYITFHPEACTHFDRALQRIHDLGIKSGLVFNPGTPLSYLDYVMDKIDMILIMSVNPGFGGQSFIESAIEKIENVRSVIDSQERPIRLEVDGGIKAANIERVAKAGADTFVAGSAIFGSEDYAQTIRTLREHIDRAHSI